MPEVHDVRVETPSVAQPQPITEPIYYRAPMAGQMLKSQVQLGIAEVVEAVHLIYPAVAHKRDIILNMPWRFSIPATGNRGHILHHLLVRAKELDLIEPVLGHGTKSGWVPLQHATSSDRADHAHRRIWRAKVEIHNQNAR